LNFLLWVLIPDAGVAIKPIAYTQDGNHNDFDDTTPNGWVVNPYMAVLPLIYQTLATME